MGELFCRLCGVVVGVGEWLQTFFIVGKTPSASIKRRCGSFGSIEEISTEEFANKVKKVSGGYIPKNEVPIIFDSFSEYKVNSSSEIVKTDDIFNLLIYGKINFNFILKDIQNNTSDYYIYRDKLDDIFNFIEGGEKYIVIESELGNGKTMFVEGLAAKALLGGYLVFRLHRQGIAIEEEIDFIFKQNGKKIIIIENYSTFFQTIEKIKPYKDEQTVLIFTARIYQNDVTYERLDKILNKNIINIAIDKLSDGEVDRFINFLNVGLIGQYADLTEYGKKRFINEDCKSTFKLALLEIIKSKTIQDRLFSLIDGINKSEKYHSIIVLIFVLQILDIDADIELLETLSGERNVHNIDFKKNPDILELVDFKNDCIKAKSSILAQEILLHSKNINMILKTLIKAYNNAYELVGNRNKNIYDTIVYNLTLYRNLGILLPKSQNEKSVINFYESIKNKKRNKEHPQFWLQFAIAELFFEKYEYARQYFETAHGLAKKRSGYDTFMLDNHYARYILEYSIYKNDINNCMGDFKSAHSILIKQVSDGDKSRYYPYRVVGNYENFHRTFYTKLSSEDRKYFVQCCKNILSYKDRISTKLRENRDVVKTMTALYNILNSSDD